MALFCVYGIVGPVMQMSIEPFSLKFNEFSEKSTHDGKKKLRSARIMEA